MTDEEAERKAWLSDTEVEQWGTTKAFAFRKGFRAGLAHARKEVDHSCHAEWRAGAAFARKEAEQLEDDEAARWQRRIAETIERYGLETFDVSGNESGDPLDWTDDQVAHALGAQQERIAALERVEKEARAELTYGMPHLTEALRALDQLKDSGGSDGHEQRQEVCSPRSSELASFLTRADLAVIARKAAKSVRGPAEYLMSAFADAAEESDE